MPDEHVFEKDALDRILDGILEKTLGELDDKKIFDRVREIPLQKGIAGTVIEQCVLNYPPDSEQRPDLVIIENGIKTYTELKTTGMVIKNNPSRHYEAKEPMSITGVGIYTIANQSFQSSHFWNKLEHLLLVYYLYNSPSAVPAYEYRRFPVKGYEFHEFNEDDKETLKQDWEHVHGLICDIVSHHSNLEGQEWQDSIKKEYIERHSILRNVLSFIDLAPKFPPRFRLKKPVVNNIISKHFNHTLEQLPERYISVSEIDSKCKELTNLYSGSTVAQLVDKFGISSTGKNLSEKIVISMFGGKSKRINQIELFSKFGLIAKTIVLSSKDGRTEDMKLFHVDFKEITRQQIVDEDSKCKREIQFEDSELYSYFADHEILCVIFKEPENNENENHSNSLLRNKFLGFQRVVFSEEFINTKVRQFWDDTRDKIINNKLELTYKFTKDGEHFKLKSGDISSAPNFMKSSENEVFMRGSGVDSSEESKTEIVNNIRMIPQYVWIKGKYIVSCIKNNSFLN